jgi:arsenate reductase (thioredoxin)
MAEGFLRHWAGDKFDVFSAGSHPETTIMPMSIQVMNEVGIDISRQHPKSLDEFKDQSFDYVITLCDYARDFCPIFHGRDGAAERLHWTIADPHKQSNEHAQALAAYRTARDLIAKSIVEWLDQEFGIKIDYKSPEKI